MHNMTVLCALVMALTATTTAAAANMVSVSASPPFYSRFALGIQYQPLLQCPSIHTATAAAATPLAESSLTEFSTMRNIMSVKPSGKVTEQHRSGPGRVGIDDNNSNNLLNHGSQVESPAHQTSSLSTVSARHQAALQRRMERIEQQQKRQQQQLEEDEQSVDATHRGPMLMIEGPKLTGFDFSAGGGEHDGGGGGGREPFVIHGHRIVLHSTTTTDKEEEKGHEDGQDAVSHTSNTAKSVWDCSILLSKYMEALEVKSPGFWNGKRVLELGAGQGIASLSAAALGAKKVIVTDVPTALPSLRQTAELNGFFKSHQIKVMELDWTDRAEAMEKIKTELASTTASTFAPTEPYQSLPPPSPPLDFILASDVIWVDYLVPALVETIADLFQIPMTETVKRRDSKVDSDDFSTVTLQSTVVKSSSTSSPILLLGYQFRSTRSDRLLFESLDQLGLTRRKLELDSLEDRNVPEGGDNVFLDPQFRKPSLAVWKVWKEYKE